MVGGRGGGDLWYVRPSVVRLALGVLEKRSLVSWNLFKLAVFALDTLSLKDEAICNDQLRTHKVKNVIPENRDMPESCKE